jgi:hypothetical protein
MLNLNAIGSVTSISKLTLTRINKGSMMAFIEIYSSGDEVV